MLVVLAVISALVLSVISNTAVARGQSDGAQLSGVVHPCWPIEEARRFIADDIEWQMDADGVHLLEQCLEPGQTVVIVAGLPKCRACMPLR